MSPLTPQELTDRLKAEARRLGFDLVGVTDCTPPASYSAYEAWLQAGHHAGMAYMASERNRARRANPRRILPECESIVVLAVRYFAPQAAPQPADDAAHGRVAAYAWGADYHDVLLPRLRALVDFLETEVGHPIPNRYYTDTGPILERDLAQRAGLGWIGKNAMLIHPRLGSYFFLAEILLGLRLVPDPPFPTDHCGTCTRCIEACPTNAILPNRTVDANRCLSYHTIENKGVLPAEIRPRMGDWVFGCDVCQMVCPWNRRAPASGDPAFAPREDVPHPVLAAELRLTPQAFNRKFKGSPVKRTKRRGYLRNVAIALGNAQQTRAVPDLSAALRDAEPLVRAHAAWALGQIGDRAACHALQAAFDAETEAEVRAEIAAALTTCERSQP